MLCHTHTASVRHNNTSLHLIALALLSHHVWHVECSSVHQSLWSKGFIKKQIAHQWLKVTSVKQSVNGESSRERAGVRGTGPEQGQAVVADARAGCGVVVVVVMMRTDTSHMRPPLTMQESPLRYVQQSTYARTHTDAEMHACTQARNSHTTARNLRDKS